ncbi:leucyl aminopeptidase family protein [Candidatus Gracilibacteria bacterium]|nr:leucyl aminopeptidase family protein [Candidatus Gracilibacteria bacterium]
MLDTKLHIQIATDVANVSTHTLLLEINESNIFEKLEKFQISVPEKILEKIQNAREKEDFFIFYPENENIFQVVIFFSSNEKRLEKRTEIFRKLSKNVTYIPDDFVEEAYEAFVLTMYDFSQYKSKKDNFDKIFFVEDVSNLSKLESKNPLYEAIYTARNLVNLPPNDFYPETFVEMISSRKWNHFEVQVFGNTELRELGCNLIRAVGQGSARDNFMVILKPKKEISGEKFGIIGKGVTFDAGGIQIKPDKYMLDMKCDMAGAAGVLGVAIYLDSLLELPVNVVFGLGIVENMTGSAAFKPLDIYTAYNGKTVEIHHTDAEGRLVLADVMTYVEKNFQVNHLITMATLTGACIYALGNDISGIMGDDEKLISTFLDNTSPYETVWRLPLTPKMLKAVESETADLQNLSESEKAGSSMGAAFLTHFKGDAQLTHLDIAGPAYRTKTFGYMPVGGTGWGVKKISEVLLSL